MEPGINGGFERRWGLTAPESYVLLHGPEDARQIFKLALLELVARGHLELVETNKPGRSRKPRKTVVLRHGPNRGRPESRSLASVLTLFTGAIARPTGDDQSEMTVLELARSARTRFGSFEDYVETQVMPGLKRRNLFERRTRRRLGLFQTTRWEPTHSGEAAKAELRGSMSLAEQSFEGWVDQEPSRAVGFLGLAGSAALLMPSLDPGVRRLREHPEYHRLTSNPAVAGYAVVATAATSDEDAGDMQGESGEDFDLLDLEILHSSASQAGVDGAFGGTSDSIDLGLGGGFWDFGGWGGGGSSSGGSGGWSGDGGSSGWGSDVGGGGGDGGGGGS